MLFLLTSQTNRKQQQIHPDKLKHWRWYHLGDEVSKRKTEAEMDGLRQ